MRVGDSGNAMIFHREKKMNKPVAFPGNASNPMYRKELEEHVRTGLALFVSSLQPEIEKFWQRVENGF